jgi:hypothetical protein
LLWQQTQLSRARPLRALVLPELYQQELLSLPALLLAPRVSQPLRARLLRAHSCLQALLLLFGQVSLLEQPEQHRGSRGSSACDHVSLVQQRRQRLLSSPRDHVLSVEEAEAALAVNTA